MTIKNGQVATLMALRKIPQYTREFNLLTEAKLFVRTKDYGDTVVVTEVACLNDRLHVWTLYVPKNTEKHGSTWTRFPDHQGEISNDRMSDIFELIDSEWGMYENGGFTMGRIETLNAEDEVNRVQRAWILYKIEGMKWIDIPKEIKEKEKQNSGSAGSKIPWSLYD
ncbi:hypothetical protein V8C42DRAFT_322424 [Trichoderma barbatum]